MPTTSQKPDVKQDEDERVDTAGDDSFPASDPPAWTPVTGPAHQKEKSAINDNAKDDPLKKSQHRHKPKDAPDCCS